MLATLIALSLTAATAADFTVDQVLVLPPMAPNARAPFRADPIQAGIAAGRWPAPREGDEVGTQKWRSLTHAPGKPFEDDALVGGYAYATFESSQAGVMILEAAGHGMLYFNGHPHVGDPYEYGTTHIPVEVLKGSNTLLIAAGRGHLSISLTEPASSGPYIDTADTTLPDVVEGELGHTVAGIMVINPRDSWQKCEVGVACEGAVSKTDVPPIPPMSFRKVAVSLPLPASIKEETLRYDLTLVQVPPAQQPMPSAASITLRVRHPEQTRKVTFVSEIDGSVQYYCRNPMTVQLSGEAPPLILSLHGASVEATSQADAYRAKAWADIVAPTNRRPFGFDWEDWGRLDALEVLEHASNSLGSDPQRTYLVGHSMGGHGTWSIGALFRAASRQLRRAGWTSFWTYPKAVEFAAPGPVEAMFRRAALPSDTVVFKRNYLHEGVYILHGDADDNVPVEQARRMRKELAEFHADFAYYERPGAGHWWGNECVDWPPLMEFIKGHVLPADSVVGHVEFVTPSPAVSSSCHWAVIEQQQVQSTPSMVDLDLDLKAGTLGGKTSNVARLRVDLRSVGQVPNLTVKLDGGALEVVARPGDPQVHLARVNNAWVVAAPLQNSEKGPHRAGPFKHAFNHRAVLVYGTGGTPEEKSWAFDKARYDAETFWYRGNGAFEVVPDTVFSAEAYRDRSVIIYGNADTNAAWAGLLGDSPIVVKKGSVKVGKRTYAGDDLAVMFVRPRQDSSVAMVGVVAPTGVAGGRACDRAPYFVSGIAYPDWTVFTPRVFEDAYGGVKGAGFFGNAWELDAAQTAFAE